jgi:hypothetical protein
MTSPFFIDDSNVNYNYDYDFVTIMNNGYRDDHDDDDYDTAHHHHHHKKHQPQQLQKLEQQQQQQQVQQQIYLQEQEQQVEEMLRTLPTNDTMAYYEALQACPSIVHTESPIAQFLDVSNGNIRSAAVRLAEYWKVRHQLFQHRAYHPMTLREDGALFPDDRPLWDHASVVLMPHTDIWGRSMVFVDRSRLSLDHSTYPLFDENKLRCMFLLFHMACCDNPMTQKDGMVLLVAANAAPQGTLFGRVRLMVKNALPISSVELHLFFLPSRSSLVVGLVEQIFSYLIELSGLMGEFVIVHRGQTDEDIVQGIMTKLGITKRMIPTWVGGTWKKEDYKRWFHSRVTTITPNVRSKVAINSQMKREKQLHLEMNLKRQMVHLKSENGQLQTKNKCLEQLLAKAQEHIVQLE